MHHPSQFEILLNLQGRIIQMGEKYACSSIAGLLSLLQEMASGTGKLSEQTERA